MSGRRRRSVLGAVDGNTRRASRRVTQQLIDQQKSRKKKSNFFGKKQKKKSKHQNETTEQPSRRKRRRTATNDYARSKIVSTKFEDTENNVPGSRYRRTSLAKRRKIDKRDALTDSKNVERRRRRSSFSKTRKVVSTKFELDISSVIIDDESCDPSDMPTSANLSDLLQHLLSSPRSSKTIKCFFAALPHFNIKTMQIMKIVNQIYSNYKKMADKLRLFHFLKIWLANFFARDFDKQYGPEPSEEVLKFSEKLQGDGFVQESSTLRKIILTLNNVPTAQDTLLNIPYMEDREHLHSMLITLPRDIIADQLTRIDCKIFKNLQSSELAEMHWKDSNVPQSYPTLSKFINRFNSISRWIPTEILVEPTAKGRKRMIKIMIDLALQLFLLNNFHAVMAVIAGLNSLPVGRCVNAWKMLPRKYRTSLDQLEEIFSHQGNYSNYRKLLCQNTDQDKPIVPYIGLFMKDLTFWEESNQSPANEYHYNFHQIYSLGKIVFLFENLKMKTCSIADVKEVSKYLQHLPYDPEDELLVKV
eukprot:TRINITY_DN12400_c0_g1_i1.p1 TRINITY_DN12400_c0_g1~~TRINITY_DN12400_c0_g1_i1.p1  ORF type:complete len:530 (+),score=101.57 TRINITY_DN12400_c0_g1_i1:64-1653(+)